jgi:hypothetical protein
MRSRSDAASSDFDWRREHLDRADRELLDSMGALEAVLSAALARGDKTVKLELSVRGWMCIVDEVRDRRPRNWSRLLAADTIARFNEAIDLLNQTIDRLHEEHKCLIAGGPSPPLSARRQA